MPSFTPNYALRYPATGEAADGPTGIGNLATDVDAVLKANFGDSASSNWPSFTWLGSVSNPTLGNSAVVARTCRQPGRIQLWSINISIGSTFVAGSGAWTFPLPVTPADPNGFGQTGTVWANDSGVKVMGMFYDIESSKINLFRLSNTGTTPWSATALTFADWTPNTNDSFKMSGWYEV
jgi:hypothetical protein